MPQSEAIEYNPQIIGFAVGKGPLSIALQEARERYGKMPSKYRMVKEKANRKPHKALNLAIGQFITAEFRKHNVNFKKTVFDFFRRWHRDLKKEFHINPGGFFNLNSPERVHAVLREQKVLFAPFIASDLREYLQKSGLMRRDILNSIDPIRLSTTALSVLEKKLKNTPEETKATNIRDALKWIRTRNIMESINALAGVPMDGLRVSDCLVFADEIARGLTDLDDLSPIANIHELNAVRGRDIEFEFATRDRSYLELGKVTGDCTADKTAFQADRNIENIYWTVFPWLLDRNYQILNVYYNGAFIMKVHLLPVFVLSERTEHMALAVDAVETVRGFRDDLEEHARADWLKKQDDIFEKVLHRLIAIADRSGIECVYAERFSNTPWVRDRLNRMPEIFLHVDQINKIDELEDVFELSRELCREGGFSEPLDIFMELQMKNTWLLPRVTNRRAGVKSFAVIRGNPNDGLPMKQVIGI